MGDSAQSFHAWNFKASREMPLDGDFAAGEKPERMAKGAAWIR
jgi:hypothetical protein